MFYNVSNPDMQGSFILSGFDITVPPTTVNIGGHSSGIYNNWDWTPSGTFGDSAISIRWDDVIIAAGGSYDVRLYYGSTIPGEAPIEDIDTDGPLDFTSGLIIQVGANKDQNILLTRHDVTTPNLGIDKMRVIPRSVASYGIALIDKAINIISGELGRYGSYQNRLEYAAANADLTAENTQAAQSRIIDTNVAKTFSEFGKLQILEQSSTAMLAQANQFPQKVLELLR